MECSKFIYFLHIRYMIKRFKYIYYKSSPSGFRRSNKNFLIKKVENTVIPWTQVISDLNGEEIAETFYGKELQKTYQKEFRAHKVAKRKSDKLNVKWKGYNNCFNSQIDKKDIVK